MADGSSGPSASFPPSDPDAEPVVHRYEPGDETAVRRVFERAMTEAGTDPADIPGTADLGWIEAAYVDPGGEFLVVDVDGAVVATGGVVVDGEMGELFRVAVDPAHQRAGHASRLLDGLETAARDRGVERLVLTTARRQAAALGFYRARGYEEVGRDSHGEYRLHHFEKRLD